VPGLSLQRAHAARCSTCEFARNASSRSANRRSARLHWLKRSLPPPFPGRLQTRRTGPLPQLQSHSHAPSNPGGSASLFGVCTAQTPWTGLSICCQPRMRSSAWGRSRITWGRLPMKRCTSQREYRSSTKPASSGFHRRRISRSVSRLFTTPMLPERWRLLLVPGFPHSVFGSGSMSPPAGRLYPWERFRGWQGHRQQCRRREAPLRLQPARTLTLVCRRFLRSCPSLTSLAP
jgi:hypothetical protein